jgi:hypothetical protein
MTISDRIRVHNVRVLSENHYTLKTTTFAPRQWRMADPTSRDLRSRQRRDAADAKTIMLLQHAALNIFM